MPDIEQMKTYTLTDKNILKGDLSTYKCPDNFDAALNDRNLIFQDDCVFLTEAKQNSNSTLLTTEPIDVS